MASVVIAAHNEATVIGRCLDSLLADSAPDEFDVVVVANGCTDDTAKVAAARPGVSVLVVEEASKPAALNAGDDAAVGFPRVYLDADIAVTAACVRALSAALDGCEAGSLGDSRQAKPLAAAPRRELALDGRPLTVRAYFAVNSRLPVFQRGLFGRGVVALSEVGRRRFDEFPDMVADDLFLDSLFAAEEKVQVDQFATVVEAPLRTRDLLRRLVRVRRGNAAMRAAARAGRVPGQVRDTERMSWFRDVVLPRPWLAPAAMVYVALTILAAVAARRAPAKGREWGRDDSTRGEASGGITPAKRA